MDNGTALLGAQGNRIVDGEGNPVLLRGFGLGGWMNK
jgi:endoglucanase